MKKTYKILSIILTFLLLVSMIPITVSATTYSGTCGENLIWKLNTDTGKMVISGFGEMYDNPSWDGWDNKIISVVIADSDVERSSNITSIGTNAFNGCENLKTISIPDTVTTIGDCAFDGCEALTSVDIPDSVTTIGKIAFRYCSNLEKVVIGSGVTTIKERTFYCCIALKEITMTVSVTDIGSYAFLGCNSLTDVYYSGSEKNWEEIAIQSGNGKLADATIHCSAEDCKHSYTKQVIPPTCTEQGYTIYTCECGDNYVDDYIDATGHSYGKWTITKEATVYAEGEMERVCSCGEKEYKLIEKLPPVENDDKPEQENTNKEDIKNPEIPDTSFKALKSSHLVFMLIIFVCIIASLTTARRKQYK